MVSERHVDALLSIDILYIRALDSFYKVIIFYEDMSIDEKSSINQQKREIFEQSHHVKLEAACSIGNGILKFDALKRDALIHIFKNEQRKLTFFIPASGSGSRMFKFLFEFTSSQEESGAVKLFMDNLEKFAFYSTIPVTVREKLGALQSQYLAEYLLNEEGMNFEKLPKGLIPFHDVFGTIYNPFQEQVIQANRLVSEESEMHFTVQEGFEKRVQDSINVLNDPSKNKLSISFSNQDKNSDAYCFNLDQSPVLENDLQLQRPAGHGALIKNLNAIDGDFVLIKNIDNVQHFSKSDESNETWQLVLGLLIAFKRDLNILAKEYSKPALVKLNEQYEFLSSQEVNDFNEDRLKEIISRPSRVCGMVVNEGAPGGGPFWVKDGDRISKQIVEGVQISKSEDQQQIVQESSHFNPVFIAVSKSDIAGNHLDLNDFVDHSKNLVVKKPNKGSEIIYRELPGLWNGAMSNWNTLFLEIPATVFSPVKTALDLLKDAHKG
jgi:hypothetical protein